jgi:hypothetical protein
MLAAIAFAAASLVMGQTQQVAAKPAPAVSVESLLREMTDRDALARVPDPAYTCKQFSSYDRASTTAANHDTWFANNDCSQFLRVESKGGRKEWVMADMDGPGAVVRIWSANPKGTMRVYLDGAAAPAIEAPMTDVLGGKWAVGAPLAGVRSRGWNLYLPIPYAKHCVITSDADGFYYQVNYRTYAAGTGVETFTREKLDAARSGVERVGKELTDGRPISPYQVTHAQDWIGVAPGGETPLTFHNDWAKNKVDGYFGEMKAPGAVKHIDVFFDKPVSEQALRSLVLVADFDGERTVWAPLSDFFGLGVGASEKAKFQDWDRVASPTGFSCEWVMPFKTSARIALKNLGDTPVPVWGVARVDRWNWDERSMHFHANWRAEHPIHALGAKGTVDWNYIDITGKGVYVGDSLAIMNSVPDWWGEGDEKIYVDGETFPSHFGTGTEDYYGYAWCDPNVFQHPFHAQVRCDGNGKNNWGHSTVTRVRALDAIPFTKSLKFDMEVWHWAKCDVAYAATTYWYALPGATCNRAPQPEEAKAPIPQPPPLPKPMTIPGAECESLAIAAKSDGLVVVPQDMSGFGRNTWSNDVQLWVQARKPGDFVELTIPIDPKMGAPVRVTLYATKSWDYGIVRFTINGEPAGPDHGAPIDLYSGSHTVAATGPIDLGLFTPDANHTLRLRAELTGSNPKAEGSKSLFGLDCVNAKPEKP